MREGLGGAGRAPLALAEMEALARTALLALTSSHTRAVMALGGPSQAQRAAVSVAVFWRTALAVARLAAAQQILTRNALLAAVVAAPTLRARRPEVLAASASTAVAAVARAAGGMPGNQVGVLVAPGALISEATLGALGALSRGMVALAHSRRRVWAAPVEVVVALILLVPAALAAQQALALAVAAVASARQAVAPVEMAAVARAG